MGELFQGKVQNRIDAKGRVSVPVSFRRVLEQGDPDFQAGSNIRMSVLHWPKKKCLEVYSVNGMAELAAQVAQFPPRSPKREMFSRFVLGGATPMSLDDTGRVVLSEGLCAPAGIDREVVFVGSYGKFEIWDPEQFQIDTQEKLAALEDDGFWDAPFGDGFNS